MWSRRKAAVAAEEDAAREATESKAQETALADKTDAEILTELDLPEPETLGPGDDFTAFMGKAVPEAIRRRALRTLWRTNPVLANVDMLVDYGEDFTDAATVVANLQTTYQVGKGMLKHVEEMARQAVEKENAAEDPETPDGPEADVALAETPDDEIVEDQLEDIAPSETPETFAYEFDDDAEPAPAPPPRRMKFRTEETA